MKSYKRSDFIKLPAGTIYSRLDTDLINHYEKVIEENKTFKLDYDFAGRDGCFEDKDVFIVWDREDIQMLIDYLNQSINSVRLFEHGWTPNP